MCSNEIRLAKFYLISSQKMSAPSFDTIPTSRNEPTKFLTASLKASNGDFVL